MTEPAYDRTPAFERGLALRRRVLGAAFADTATEAGLLDPMTRDLQQLANEHVWGEIWSRKGLEPGQRSIVAVVVLAVARQNDELKLHLNGALNNGVSVQELFEIIVHLSVYAGMPATLNAARVLREALCDRSFQDGADVAPSTGHQGGPAGDSRPESERSK